MTGMELNAMYGAMISPAAHVTVPDEWMPAIHTAMQEFVDLPAEIRAFVIVLGITTDAEGDLRIEVGAANGFITNVGMQQVYAICDRALAATSGLGVRN